MTMNLSKIINSVSSVTNTFNKVIPIYKEVSPIVSNVKNAFKSFNSIKEASNEAIIEEAKSFERPITNFKKKKSTNERSTNLDTLTFFQ